MEGSWGQATPAHLPKHSVLPRPPLQPGLGLSPSDQHPLLDAPGHLKVGGHPLLLPKALGPPDPRWWGVLKTAGAREGLREAAQRGGGWCTAPCSAQAPARGSQHRTRHKLPLQGAGRGGGLWGQMGEASSGHADVVGEPGHCKRCRRRGRGRKSGSGCPHPPPLSGCMTWRGHFLWGSASSSVK